MRSEYTLIRLADVHDSGPDYGQSGIQEVRFATADLAASSTGVGHKRVLPGVRVSLGHRHLAAEEIYFVISGSGRVKLDEKILDVSAGMALRVDPAVVRAFEAGADGLEILAFGPHHPGDGEFFAGWWPA